MGEMGEGMERLFTWTLFGPLLNAAQKSPNTSIVYAPLAVSRLVSRCPFAYIRTVVPLRYKLGEPTSVTRESNISF